MSQKNFSLKEVQNLIKKGTYKHAIIEIRLMNREISQKEYAETKHLLPVCTRVLTVKKN